MAIYLSSTTVADEDELEGGVLLLFGSHGAWAIGDAIGEDCANKLAKQRLSRIRLRGRG